GERTNLDRVARGDNLDGESLRRLRHARGRKNASLRAGLENVLELIIRPVVGVLVRNDDCHDARDAHEQSRVATRVDDERVTGLFNLEAGMLVLRYSHRTSVDGRSCPTLITATIGACRRSQSASP